MVADQVTCISCTSGNCTPFGGYYTVHIGSTQHTTGLYVRQHRADQGRHNPGWLGALHLPQDLGWRWKHQKLKKKQFGGLSHSNLKKKRKNTQKYAKIQAKICKDMQQGEKNR